MKKCSNSGNIVMRIMLLKNKEIWEIWMKNKNKNKSDDIQQKEDINIYIYLPIIAFRTSVPLPVESIHSPNW